MTQPLLQVENAETYYGNIRALSGVDIEVQKGEIVCLIGANGAGKSTLMMTICGAQPARSGRIMFEGKDITRMPTHEIARMRIAHLGRLLTTQVPWLCLPHLGCCMLANPCKSSGSGQEMRRTWSSCLVIVTALTQY